MKIFINNINENWVVDNVISEWSDFQAEITSNQLKHADIVWIIAPWTWRKLQKRKIKGKSTTATKVADVKKSLRLSNSLTVLAKAPDLSFLVAKFMVINWLKINRDILASALFPALSMKLALNILIKKSKPKAISTPIVSAIKDSIA